MSGFYLNCGYWAGVMLAPGAGKWGADLVTGAMESQDNPLRFTRYEEGIVIENRESGGKVMSEITVQAIYFEKPGPKNTARTLEVAKRRADELGIGTVLVASTQGETGVQAAQLFQGYDVVVVTHSTGFAGPNVQQLTKENRAAIEAAGAKILTCQHAFGGVNRAVRKQLGTYLTNEIIASTLRTFGAGMKVCLEIVLMAADAGLVRVGEPCIAVAGTGRGADTAVVLVPAHAQQFFDLRVMEVLAKPHSRTQE